MKLDRAQNLLDADMSGHENICDIIAVCRFSLYHSSLNNEVQLDTDTLVRLLGPSSTGWER